MKKMYFLIAIAIVVFFLVGPSTSWCQQEVVINGMLGCVSPWYSGLVLDNRGIFTVVWVSKYSGVHIYAQRYTSDGIKLGSNFKVNEAGVYNIFPSISTDNFGNFAIVWSNGNSHIYAQRYTSDGIKLGSNFKVNEAGVYNKEPAITIGYHGEFVVTWTSGSVGNSHIYAQRYTSDGIKLGSNFKVNDGPIYNFSPAIAIEAKGKFSIIWRSFGVTSDIYVQRYDQDAKIGDNIKLNEHGFSVGPDISAYGDKSFLCTWQVSEGFVYLQPLDIEYGNWGHNIQITEGLCPKVCFNDRGTIVVFIKKNLDNWGRVSGYNIVTKIWPNFAHAPHPQNSAVISPHNVNLVWNNPSSPLRTSFTYWRAYLTDGGPDTSWEHGATSDSFDVWQVGNLTNNSRYIWGIHASDGIRGNWAGPWVFYTESNISPVDRKDKMSSNRFALQQNYPNPFNPSTTIFYSIPTSGHITLTIYNMLGQKVTTLVDGQKLAGSYQVAWDASEFSGGIYFYQLRTGEFTETKKLILQK